MSGGEAGEEKGSVRKRQQQLSRKKRGVVLSTDVKETTASSSVHMTRS